MAEETTVFKLEFDIPDAEKRAERVAERRPTGVTPRTERTPRTLQSRTEGRREQVGQAGSRLRRGRERAREFGSRIAKAPQIVSPQFLGRSIESGIRAIPLAGGALAATFFATRNADKVRALASLLPIGGDVAKALAGVTIDVAANLKALLQTAADTTTIVKTLGVLGETPASFDVGGSILALYKVNLARSRLMLEASNRLWDNRAAATARAALGTTVGGANLKTDIAKAQAKSNEMREILGKKQRG